MMKAKTFSSDEKFAIVLEAIKGNSDITEICRKNGISSSLFYKWRDKFFEGAKKELTSSNGKIRNIEQRYQKEIDDLNMVIGKQVVAIEAFKKKLKIQEI